MSVSLAPQRLRDEAGFTLVELLAAMVLGIIVLFGILSVFDSFTTNAARQTRVTDANEQVRVVMDRIVSDLRQARTVEVAGPLDLVYTVTDSATAVRRERICVDASSRLWRSSVTTATAPAPPIAAGTACPTAGSGATKVTSLTSANTVSDPLFTYDTSTPANVRNIGLTFALKAVTRQHVDTSRLRASAFVRAKNETALPVTPPDITTLCNSSGVPTLTLSAGVGPLTVSYTDMDGHSLGAATAAGSSTTLPAGSTAVVATISATSGAITKLVKTIAC
jgi:type II secretory pathway pseudopilin PulG